MKQNICKTKKKRMNRKQARMSISSPIMSLCRRLLLVSVYEHVFLFFVCVFCFKEHTAREGRMIQRYSNTLHPSDCVDYCTRCHLKFIINPPQVFVKIFCLPPLTSSLLEKKKKSAFFFFSCSSSSSSLSIPLVHEKNSFDQMNSRYFFFRLVSAHKDTHLKGGVLLLLLLKKEKGSKAKILPILEPLS